MQKVKLADIRDEEPASQSGKANSYGVVRVGEIMSDGIGALFANFFSFTFVSLVIYLPIILWAAISEDGLAALRGDFNQVGFLNFGIALFLTMVAGFIAYAAIVYGSLEHFASRNKGLPEIISGGISSLIPVIILSIAVVLLTMLGYILLVIPGIMVSVALYVAVPAVVAEKMPISDAFQRSLDLTDGFRWSVFGVVILTGIAGQILAFILSFAENSLLTSGDIGSLYIYLALLALQMAITTALSGAVSAATYSHLRIAKEGVSADNIAQVFS